MEILGSQKTELVQDRISEILNDVYRVGPDKPVGYLPLNTITEICKKDVTELQKELAGKNLNVVIFPGGTCKVVGGAMFVYDPNALVKLLQKNVRLLKDNRWPTRPSEFINKIAAEHAPGGTPLFDLIADSFADTTNPLRLSNKGKETS